MARFDSLMDLWEEMLLALLIVGEEATEFARELSWAVEGEGER